MESPEKNMISENKHQSEKDAKRKQLTKDPQKRLIGMVQK
jgi:hypothetical protein